MGEGDPREAIALRLLRMPRASLHRDRVGDGIDTADRCLRASNNAHAAIELGAVPRHARRSATWTPPDTRSVCRRIGRKGDAAALRLNPIETTRILLRQLHE